MVKDVVHSTVEYYRCKKGEIMPCAATWGPRDDHIEWTKSEKDKYHMYHLPVCFIDGP